MQATLIDQNLLLELTREKVGIDDLVRELAARHAFDSEDEEKVLTNHRKSVVRRAVKLVKNSQGLPLIFSIVDVLPSGKEVRKYKQLTLFTIGEYKQAIEYCRSRGRYWRKIERHLQKSAQETYVKQWELFK